jgi:hypothetical protein
MREYASPDVASARKRRLGQQLTAAGVVLAGAGLFGLVFTQLLDLVWLDPVAGLVGPLAVLALVAGGAAFFAGFQMIKAARRSTG